MARRHGASEEVLETLDDPDRCPIPESEREALRFAERMTRDAAVLGEADVNRLRVHWSDEQVVEIACVVGLFNYLNRFAEALGLWPTRESEGGPDDPEIAD